MCGEFASLTRLNFRFGHDCKSGHAFATFADRAADPVACKHPGRYQVAHIKLCCISLEPVLSVCKRLVLVGQTCQLAPACEFLPYPEMKGYGRVACFITPHCAPLEFAAASLIPA